MKSIAFSLVAFAAASAAYGAGHTAGIGHADDPWFVAGQERLAAELAKQPNTNRAKNVILLIADGNGVGSNYAIRVFHGQKNGGNGDDNVLPYEAFPNLALVKTYNTNALTPDSSGTATAFMSGVKAKSGVVGVTANANRGDCSTLPGNEAISINKILSGMGKSTGIVSTARITHATPSAAYAHSVDRNYEASVPEGCDTQTDIASQLLAAMEDGFIDVAMGGGRRNFHAGEGGRREDGRNLIEMAEGMGAQYAGDRAAFDALALDGTPILALLDDSHMDYEADRADQPSLAEMTAAAITALSNDEDGYFLQVEAGRVDHANHAGNLARAVRDGVAFAEAVAMADEMTDDADTLIVVTADHEHAIAFAGYCGRGSNILGLCMKIDNNSDVHTGEPELADDGMPYTVAGYLNGAGSVLREDVNWVGARPDLTEEEATDLDYVQQALIPKSSETHSPEDVAVYAKGPFAHLLDGTIEQNVIFHVMLHAATAE